MNNGETTNKGEEKMKKFLVAAFAVGAIAVPSALAAPPVDGVHEKVTICHNTGSATNPVVYITVDLEGRLNGHTGELGKHQDGDLVWDGKACVDPKGQGGGETVPQ